MKNFRETRRTEKIRNLFLLAAFSVQLVYAGQPQPKANPSPTPQRYRMADIKDSPSALERFEQSFVTLVGLSLFFWAPKANLNYSSGDGSIQVQTSK